MKRMQNHWRWIVDAYKDDGKRYIVHSDELLSAFLELEKHAKAAPKLTGVSRR